MYWSVAIRRDMLFDKKLLIIGSSSRVAVDLKEEFTVLLN